MSDYLTVQEKEREYPALSRLIGTENFNIRRITGKGMSAAHFVFAPEIERVLKAAVRDKLWDEFKIKVSVRRKPRRPEKSLAKETK